MEVFFESGAVILLALPFAIDIVRRLWKKTGLVPAFTGAPCALAFFWARFSDRWNTKAIC